jgi:hypothetical protein
MTRADEDLETDIGVSANRIDGPYTPPLRRAQPLPVRSCCRRRAGDRCRLHRFSRS